MSNVTAFRPASTRTEELLGYLRLAGRRGLTAAEMTAYMPRSSWRGALRDLQARPGVLLRVEQRPPRKAGGRAWTRVVLTGEYTPGDLQPAPPTATAEQLRLICEERVA